MLKFEFVNNFDGFYDKWVYNFLSLWNSLGGEGLVRDLMLIVLFGKMSSEEFRMCLFCLLFLFFYEIEFEV